MSKVLIAMSGGVDSSVAALLLQRAGYTCSGARLELLSKEDHPCIQDTEDAKNICAEIGIPYFGIEASAYFQSTVKKAFIEGYQSGKTPNPCIDCNREIKFGLFLERALKEGYDYIATGHYARIETDPITGKYLLKKGKDGKKDQSYMLYQLTQEQLAHILLPIGTFGKEEIRQIAQNSGLKVAKKADSQDICFIPDGDYVSFLKESGVALTPGNYVDSEGKILGQHRGYQCYTIGQGKGLGIALGKHVYVLGKNPEMNEVTLGDSENLFSTTLLAQGMNWISGEVPKEIFWCSAKTRYSQRESRCRVEVSGQQAQIIFEEPQRAMSPGQAIVFYNQDVVLGGGTIENVQ